MGTNKNWNINIGSNLFSMKTCTKFLFYMHDGTTMPNWLDYDPYSGGTLAMRNFYITNPREAGDFQIKVVCVDPYESTANTTFTITVYNNPPYAIKSIGTLYAQEDSDFSIDITDYYTDDDIPQG